MLTLQHGSMASRPVRVGSYVHEGVCTAGMARYGLKGVVGGAEGTMRGATRKQKKRTNGNGNEKSEYQLEFGLGISQRKK